MEAVKFTLRGAYAFFKNPEVNTYYYFTFGQIHKPALLGMFGAICGLKGYESNYEVYPEYYEKLKNLHISIVPESPAGRFVRTIQQFNNSVGYASQEAGGNLIVKEQWLENPKWTVYLMLDCEEAKQIAAMLLNHQCIFSPYLGKNDHPATIEDVSVVNVEKIEIKGKRVHSLFIADTGVLDKNGSFKYQEYLPIALNEKTNHYEMKLFYFTDTTLLESKDIIYTDGEINLAFY